MEVIYELLWRICNGLLLSFLVSGLLSLILYCPNSIDDDVGDRKMVKNSLNGGKKKKKRVKFADQVDEIRIADDGFVKDVEVDGVQSFVGVEESGEKGEILRGDGGVGFVKDSEVDEVNCLMGVEESGEKDEILRGESEDGGVRLVDDGFVRDSEVDEVNRVVYVEESGVKDGILMGLSGDGGVGLVELSEKDEISVGCDVHVSLVSDELVDDQKEHNSMNSSMELGCGENEVDKIIGCDVHETSSSVNEEERIGRVFAGGENEVDQVDNSAECDGFEKDGVVHHVDVTLGGDKLVDDDKIVDDQREEEAKGTSNVGSQGRSCGVFDEEEWEGIERSDLAKEFARAKGFVENGDKERRLAMAGGNDLMMQLYGLEKVAMEGPCHEPQPMALKFAARVKWNAWQKLGNMSPEEAMEQYISVLSQNVPEWMEGQSSVHSLADTHMSTSFQESDSANLRTSKATDLVDVSTAVDQDKE